MPSRGVLIAPDFREFPQAVQLLCELSRKDLRKFPQNFHAQALHPPVNSRIASGIDVAPVEWTGIPSSSEWSSGWLLRMQAQGDLEDNAMLQDVREGEDILELLKAELAFVEQGGYGRSVRTPWLPKSVFQDSLSCINYADPNHTHPCSECQLMGFVTKEHKTEEIPCHFIPLNDAGETIEDLEAQDNQAKLEATLKHWMREKIKEIENARARRQKT